MLQQAMILFIYTHLFLFPLFMVTPKYFSFFSFCILLPETGLLGYESELPKPLGSSSLAPGTRLWHLSGGEGH